MPLSLHIAQGNTRRVVGRKLPARISVLRLGLITRTRSAVTNIMKLRREMRHPSPALDKQPITESPTNEKFRI